MTSDWFLGHQKTVDRSDFRYRTFFLCAFVIEAKYLIWVHQLGFENEHSTTDQDHRKFPRPFSLTWHMQGINFKPVF